MRGAIGAVCAILTVGVAFARPAFGEEYPNRPISLVVPFSAGGAVDTVGRLIGNQLSKGLGQPVVVENVTGAGGTIAAARVARASPDGYTLLVGNLGTQVASVGSFKNLAYDPRTDFAPVMIIADAPEVLLVGKDFPAKSLKEFMALARKKGEEVTIGHAGVGSISYLTYLLYNKIGNSTSAVPIPYRGDIEADKDLVGGRISAAFNWTILAAPYVTSGQLRALAVLSPQRSPSMPDVPTSAEAGLPNLVVNAWTALFFPKGTPQPIIERVNAVLKKSFEDEALTTKMKGLGLGVPAADQQSPEALDRLVSAEFERWLPLMQAKGPENALNK
jgi:tripartite-type tricarboxylate transporter receptor subunit TctC